MGAKDVLTRKTGVIVGDDVLNLFKYAQQKNFAIPAIVSLFPIITQPCHWPRQNVTSSSTVVASLEAARDKKSPIILQTSQGGAAYFAGKGVDNKDQSASIAGAIAAAHYIRSIAPAYGIPVVLHSDHCAKKLLPWLDGMMDADEKYFKEHGEPLFSSHMIDLSEEAVDWNIETTAKYLKRAAPMKQWLEMVRSSITPAHKSRINPIWQEIGITGGEEDGVNNEDVDNNSLYTQPEDINNIWTTLSKISPYFSIAAGFGNVHGVYKPGNVKLHPELLGKHQAFVKQQNNTKEEKPVFLVFHGGSGSTKKEYTDAIGYGVVKVNLDTDLQYAYLTGIRDYVLSKKDYLMKPVGNPDGEDKPNKKYFDPRVWVREGEKTMTRRVEEGLEDFNTANQLWDTRGLGIGTWRKQQNDIVAEHDSCASSSIRRC
jgi:fructose-bisphosphate aldolase, class II